MKANKAEKSKFVYPDKLYARTKDNITLDISYAPQTLEAVEYTRTDAVVNKVVNFLNYKLDDVVAIRVPGTIIPHHVAKQELIEDFKDYMKGE